MEIDREVAISYTISKDVADLHSGMTALKPERKSTYRRLRARYPGPRPSLSVTLSDRCHLRSALGPVPTVPALEADRRWPEPWLSAVATGRGRMVRLAPYSSHG